MTTPLFSMADMVIVFGAGLTLGAVVIAVPAVLRERTNELLRSEAAEYLRKAETACDEIRASREHFFAFAAQPLQQHAALSGADLPALSAQSHEDEQAPSEDDDHTGWWQVLLATLIAAADEAVRIVAVGLNGCRARALVLVAGYRKPKQRGRHWADGVNHTGHFSIIRRRGGEN